MKLSDQSECPMCYGRTSIGRTGKTLFGKDIFICHHCRRLFYDDGRELSEDEKKLIIESKKRDIY